MSRRFSKSQRIALFLEADGKCAACNTELKEEWHADHIVPYTKGGLTTLENGQALCPDCNLKKGDRVVGGKGLSPWIKKLRLWQDDAYTEYLHKGKENFLAVATPAAGKTMFALRVAHHLFTTDKIDRMVIVVPTDNLRGQWAHKAHDIAGIELETDWTNSEFPEASDQHGVTVTYQQIGANPRASRLHCQNRRTFVVFDEIHHVGDTKPWSDAIQHAFEPAVRRLGISGTLFRTDDNPIPYVKYSESGHSVPDFSYGYRDALSDNVCRPVFFPSYEGDMRWVDLEKGETVDATFRTWLPTQDQMKRLNTALDPKADWLRGVIRDADRKLSEVRKNGHPDAGGLIVAKKQAHAKNIAGLVNTVTGQYPSVAVSDEPDASNKINEFRTGKSRWIVAVRMVSEGIDIPRLRVGVYATNILTELHFRQFVGRFLRVQPNLEEQSAHIYIPHDTRLVEFAEQIKKERNHQLRERITRTVHGERVEGQLSIYYPVSSKSRPDDVIHDEVHYTQAEIERARLARSVAGVDGLFDDVQVAKLIRAFTELNTKPIESVAKQVSTPPLINEKKDKKKLIKRMVSELYYMNEGRLEFYQIHNRLIQMDNTKLPQCTLEQLEARIRCLDGWIKNGYFPSF